MPLSLDGARDGRHGTKARHGEPDWPPLRAKNVLACHIQHIGSPTLRSARQWRRSSASAAQPRCRRSIGPSRQPGSIPTARRQREDIECAPPMGRPQCLGTCTAARWFCRRRHCGTHPPACPPLLPCSAQHLQQHKDGRFSRTCESLACNGWACFSLAWSWLLWSLVSCVHDRRLV